MEDYHGGCRDGRKAGVKSAVKENNARQSSVNEALVFTDSSKREDNH